MATLKAPAEIEIYGPWLITESELESLHEIVEKIEDILQSVYKSDKTPKRVVVKSKKGASIEDNTILGIIKDEKIEDFNPSELLVEINKGEFKFKLEITSEDTGCFYTNHNIEDVKLSQDIRHEIRKWIRKNQPSWVHEKWASTYQLIIIFSLILTIIGTSMLDKSISRLDAYQSQLKIESHELLSSGINNDNISKAVNILLQYQTSYIPKDFSYIQDPENNISSIWLAWLICSVVILIKPRTIIGLGKKKIWAQFYKKWIYLVGAIILGVIIGLCTDFIKSLTIIT
ncbi:MAG: hypothetical protein COA31_006935 [Flavobacteriales bacterium]|nr:hypothetical protein [Flavobacteriales bacterium]